MLYLDTSAFLKLYLIEEDSALIQSVVSGQDDPLPVWEFLEAEFTNALWLKVFWKDISVQQAEDQLRHFELRKRSGQYFHPEINSSDLMKAFRELTEHTRVIGCRTLDIMHVACARLLQVEHFVSCDDRQRTLASRADLAVLPE